MKALTIAALLAASACAYAQDNGSDPGTAANAGSNDTRQKIDGDAQSGGATDTDTGTGASAPDPRLKEIDDEIALIKKRTELLEEEKKLQEAKKNSLGAKYPVATIADLKKGDASNYENTAFLANWALSANMTALKPVLPQDTVCSRVLVSDDPAIAGKMLAARSIETTVDSLRAATGRWLADAAHAKPAAADRNKKNEGGYLSAITLGQSLVTQTLDMLKYFRTDIDFKPVTVKLSDAALRSIAADACPGGARLPSMAAPRDSALLNEYARLLIAGESVRLQSDKDNAALPASLKARGAALVAGIDALKTQLSSNDGGIPALVTAAQLLAHRDASQILSIQVMDQGGTVYKRSNLFFLSPKVSYVTAASVTYTLSDLHDGRVRWQQTRQVRAQLNQRFAPWSVPEAADGATSTTVVMK
ncbi:hypothetical protein D9T17_12030 [Lysobacter enzymogenes]|uniref:Lipoprotein n=2 Tax=Lysobacter enzymogenes TaxID=69 RepID=A0A3N2RGZ0_LYSEN|nr:hypothetical protein D9T17_12030 [Lysobacter enzymogenes]